MTSKLLKYCREHTPEEDRTIFLEKIIEKSMDECEKDGRQNW